MKTTIHKTIITYLASYLKTQCSLTAISLPILTYWGIPISLMTIVGNLIFAPLFLVFLIVSSVVFTLELISKPNPLFIGALEGLSNIIYYLLNYGSASWLWGIRAPHGAIIIIALIITILILKHPALRNPARSCLASITLSIIMCISFNFLHKNQEIEPFAATKFSIHNTQDGLVIEDKGEFSSHSAIDNFVFYDLSSWIRRSYGQTKINLLRLLKPNYRSLKAALTLLSLYEVKSIEIMSANFDSPPYLKKYLGRLYASCRSSKINLIWLQKEAKP